MTKTIYYNTLFPKDIKDFGLIRLLVVYQY
jgi:hypothetical protein